MRHKIADSSMLYENIPINIKVSIGIAGAKLGMSENSEQELAVGDYSLDREQAQAAHHLLNCLGAGR